MAITQLPVVTAWLNGKECGPNVVIRIHQEQDLKRDPDTGEMIPDKLWTSARMIIDSFAIGESEDDLILAAQSSRERVTLAHTWNGSVMIARDLHVLDYNYSGQSNHALVEAEFKYGAPLEKMPLDKWLASLEKSAA